jgi:hypothetical protein
MARPGENAGMSVEDRAGLGAVADARDDLVRDRGIDLPPLLPRLVERVEGAGVRVRPFDPGRRYRVVDGIENLVRALDGQSRFRGQVRGGLDPGADDGERAARRRGRITFEARRQSPSSGGAT